MNSKYQNCPELIASVREITSHGDDVDIGDRVTGIRVRIEGTNKPAIAQLDVRDLRKNINLIIEIELSELVSALSLATLNADKE